MSEFNKVTVTREANIYFDGQVTVSSVTDYCCSYLNEDCANRTGQ